MPPDGKSPLVAVSRIMPSQNVGIDQNASAIPVDALSNMLLRRQAERVPSHRPSATARIVPVPTSNTVGHSFSRIISPTGREYWYESPKSPCSSLTREPQNRASFGLARPYLGSR